MKLKEIVKKIKMRPGRFDDIIEMNHLDEELVDLLCAPCKYCNDPECFQDICRTNLTGQVTESRRVALEVLAGLWDDWAQDEDIDGRKDIHIVEIDLEDPVGRGGYVRWAGYDNTDDDTYFAWLETLPFEDGSMLFGYSKFEITPITPAHGLLRDLIRNVLDMQFIFDIDGTLTPARERMTKEHASKFSRWMKGKKFYLITGSDLVKTIAQVPLNIMGSANFTFCCLGNVLYEPIDDDHYSRIRNHSPEWSAELLQACQGFVDTSAFEKRCGNHIERRIGVLNVSAVGRKASKEERQKYSDWDLINKEREAFVEKINETFDDYEASIGGMISIDITATGMHKGQILDDIDGDVVFFGDRIANGGNDYPLADRIEREERGVVHAVSGPEETIDILLGEYCE